MEHVDFQLPNEKARIKYASDDIPCSDVGFQDTITMVKNNQCQNGMIGNFKSTALCVFPYDPVYRRKNSRS